jgi:hypothetical protein
MQDMESALSAAESAIIEAQKSADALVKALKRLRRAAGEGHLVELEKGLAAVGERGLEAAEAATALKQSWDFDAGSHLEGGYSEELLAEAGRQGVNLFARDRRLYAFPLLLRIEPREGAVRIGKKLERRLRPKHFVKLLAALQKRPQRFREDRFLALLYDLYRQLAEAEWRKIEKGPGPALSLAQLHDLLTLLPGTDYPLEEFGRDLLLLDRRPDLRTKDGASFDFVASALARGSMKRITVYDEDGNERTYIAIRFLKDR